MNCRSIAVIILSVFFSEECKCQVDSIFAEGLYDTILEESAEGADDSELYNVIEYYNNNPIDLNKISLESLLQLPFVDYRTACAILKYKSKTGRFFSSAQLYSVENLSPGTISKIAPFFYVDNTVQSPVVQKYKETGNSEKFKMTLRSRIINNNKNDDFKYTGTSMKQYNRLLMKYGEYQLGFTTEKDPGENNYLDFNSFYLEVKNEEQSSMLIIGDYTVEFGQGLVMWGPYGVTKTSEINSVIKNSRDIIPYAGSNENRFFRGMAFSIKQAGCNISSFISNNKFDAVLNDADDKILSMPQDGNHRTQSEIKNDDKGRELFYGGKLEYVSDSLFSIGALYCHSNFTPSLFFKGMTNSLHRTDSYSIAFKYFINDLFLTGETAGADSKVSVNTLLNMTLSSKVQFVVSYRNYPGNFTTLHSSAASETGYNAESETGIFSGLKLSTIIGNISLYYDQFRSSFKGSELLFYCSKDINSALNLSIKYKVQKKEQASLSVLNDARTEVVYRVSNELTLKSRFDYGVANSDALAKNEKGILLFQDFRMRVGEMFIINGRITYYNTAENFRMYEYENDLPGIVNNKILTGEGIKLYFLITYRLSDFLDLSLKYHQNNKSGSIGQLSYSDDTMFSFQIDMKL